MSDQFVIIVHPLKETIEWFEKTYLFQIAQRYNRDIPEEALYPFRRYNGYRRVIVLPGKPDQPQFPHIDELSKEVELKLNDIVISDGIPYSPLTAPGKIHNYFEFLEEGGKLPPYPEFCKVAENIIQVLDLVTKRKLPFLPSHSPTLIFGGHHSDDCVRKLALEFKRKGFRSYIDPLITELYYKS